MVLNLSWKCNVNDQKGRKKYICNTIFPKFPNFKTIFLCHCVVWDLWLSGASFFLQSSYFMNCSNWVFFLCSFSPRILLSGNIYLVHDIFVWSLHAKPIIQRWANGVDIFFLLINISQVNSMVSCQLRHNHLAICCWSISLSAKCNSIAGCDTSTFFCCNGSSSFIYSRWFWCSFHCCS